MFTRQEVSTLKTFNTICNVKRGVCIFHLILVGHRIPDFRVSVNFDYKTFEMKTKHCNCIAKTRCNQGSTKTRK